MSPQMYLVYSIGFLKNEINVFEINFIFIIFTIRVLRTEPVYAVILGDVMLDDVSFFFCACLHSSLEVTVVLDFCIILKNGDQAKSQNCKDFLSNRFLADQIIKMRVQLHIYCNISCHQECITEKVCSRLI